MLSTTTTAAWAAGSLARVGGDGGQPQANILFVLSDDQVFRAMGAMGNAEIRTPNQDRLAREGVLFTHAHISNPICTPSRAAILTGRYGFTSGVTFFGHAIQPGVPTIGHLLSQAGYDTGYVGKWHNDHRPCDHGFHRMCHVFLGGMHHYRSIPVVQESDDKPAELQGHPTDTFAEGALELLDQLEEPFCLFVCFTAPHDPRQPPAEYEARYPAHKVSLPANFMPEPPFDTGTLDIRDEKLMPRPLDPEHLRAEIGRYYGLIAHLDAHLGRLLDRLEDRGVVDRTAVIYAGDNGLTLGAHGLLGKQTMYEEGVRVPLILRAPGLRGGRRNDALVDLMDIMPTMCELAGTEEPEGVQARSLLPTARGNRSNERDVIFCHYNDLFRMVRTRRHKLIAHLETGREELFDLREDPLELNDLSASAAHGHVLAELRESLHEQRQAAGELTDQAHTPA